MVISDEIGPEKILEVFDRKTGMHGFTVIDNTALGPGKGGIRMTPSVSIEEVAKLARTMTWKNALAELPFGGAKSGIIADDRKLTGKQKDAIIAAFSKAIKPICPSLYIAGPDINTAEHEMEVFAKANGDYRSCTGKPKNLCIDYSCGIPHELGSTGYGAHHAALVAAKFIGMNIKNASVAIEGFGNVGTFAAQFLAEKGAKIIAVSDSKGCIYNKNGLNIKKLLGAKQKTGSVVNYSDGKVIDGNKIFELKADILMPAARPNVITASNYGKVKAKIIVEGSNIPIPEDIEAKLHKKGVLVVPDFVANAGGVISSYIEYMGGKATDVFQLIEKKITRNTRIVLEHSKKQKITPREAALEIAKKRVLEAMKKKREL